MLSQSTDGARLLAEQGLRISRPMSETAFHDIFLLKTFLRKKKGLHMCLCLTCISLF
jgi:hypothetical protein